MLVASPNEIIYDCTIRIVTALLEYFDPLPQDFG